MKNLNRIASTWKSCILILFCVVALLLLMNSILLSSATDSTASNNYWKNAWSISKSVPGNLINDFYVTHTAPFRMTKKQAFWTSGFMATGVIIYVFDQDINDSFQRSRGSFVYDKIMEVGEFAEPIGLKAVTTKYYAGMFLVGVLLQNDFLTDVNLQLLETAFATYLLKSIVNQYTGRPRPNEGYDVRKWGVKGARSFFSGHCSTIFQVATIVSHHVDYKPFSLLAYSVATAVAFERIDSQSHWASDVFVGSMYGIVMAKSIIRLNEKRDLNISIAPTKLGDVYGINISYNF